MLSIIIPFQNEEQNLEPLYERLHQILTKIGEDWEVIFVDDGSTDQGYKKINDINQKNSNVILIRHKRKIGKGQALASGVKKSKGDILIFMDADLQDDPADIPKFLNKTNEGYDFVNGWRKTRNDPISKTLPSSVFNSLLLKTLLKSKFHDINCGYKSMRRQVFDDIPLYGDNYRFLPLIAESEGFKTTEVVVTHHKRKFGSSKYGFFRLFFGLFDTLTTYFIYKFSEKPLHFFGPIGGTLFSLGLFITIILSIERIFFGVLLYRRPILWLGILLIIVGIQIVMTGIIGELIVYLNKKNESYSRSYNR